MLHLRENQQNIWGGEEGILSTLPCLSLDAQQLMQVYSSATSKDNSEFGCACNACTRAYTVTTTGVWFIWLNIKIIKISKQYLHKVQQSKLIQWQCLHKIMWLFHPNVSMYLWLPSNWSINSFDIFLEMLLSTASHSEFILNY